jgi:hypothetical protein
MSVVASRRKMPVGVYFYSSGSRSWGICLGLQLKDDLLSLILTELTQDFGKLLEVNDTSVIFYASKVQRQKAGAVNKKLPPPPGSGAVKPSR